MIFYQKKILRHIILSLASLLGLGLCIWGCEENFIKNSPESAILETAEAKKLSCKANVPELALFTRHDLARFSFIRRGWTPFNLINSDSIDRRNKPSFRDSLKELNTEAFFALHKEDYNTLLEYYDLINTKLELINGNEKSVEYFYASYLDAVVMSLYRRFQDAELLFKKIESEFSDSIDTIGIDLYCGLLNDLGLVLYRNNKIIESENVLLKAMNLSEENCIDEYIRIMNLVYLTELYWSIGDYHKSYHFIVIAEDRVAACPENIFASEAIARIFHWKGLVENGRLNRKRAIDNYKKASIYYQNSKRTTARKNLQRLIESIGLSQSDLKEWEQAINNLEIARQQAVDLNLSIRHVLGSEINLGDVYLKTGLYDSAFKYLNSAYNLLSEINFEHEDKHILCSYKLAELYQGLRDYEKSQKFYLQSLKIIHQLKRKDDFQEALIYSGLSRLSEKEKKFNEAVVYAQKAMNLMFESFHEDSYIQNPTIESIEVEITTLFEIMVNKAQVVHSKALFYSNLPDLHLSLETYQLAQQVVDSMRTDIRSQTDKFIFLDEVFPLYDGALETAWQLQQRGEPSIKEAFHLLEKGKANVLHESLQEEEARLQVGLPKEVIEKEQYVKQEISSFEKRLDRAKQDSTISDSLVNNWRDKLIGLRKSQDSLLTTIKRDYPNYYQMRYDLSVVDLSLIQDSLLEEDQAMIEYFVGTEAIYAVTLTKDTVRLHRIEKDFALESWVKNMLEGIYGYHSKPTDLRSDSLKQQLTQNYAIYGHKLYEKLIAPLEADESLPEKLIIVPDGVLGYLPFDALLSGSISELGNYQHYPYLVHQHQISYCYSATLWKQMRSGGNEIIQNKVLAMGLSFPDGGDGSLRSSVTRGAGFSKLRYAKLELDSLTKALPTTRLTEEDATVFRFKQMAPQYAAIHLSTHGVLNDEETEYSYLALAGADPYSSSDSGKLYIKDLYNIPLNAELVVLSACETGLGELFKGEGIISLARGFAYAGAKSIITTLWSVDDMSTARITGNFYKHLRQGHEKDEALRLARMDYFKSMDTHAAHHPFYWAAMTPVGDMSPLKIDDTPSTTIFLIIGAVVILILLLIWFYLRSRNSWRQNT